MLKCDLHLHSKEDEQAIKYTAKELIDRAAELNFDVLSFTFHDKVFYPKELVEYAKAKDILLIPGAELTLEGKHVLVYGLNDISEIKDFDDLKNYFSIAAHPFFKTRTCLGKELIENIDLFDAVEHSHFYNHLIDWNKKGIEVAKKFSISLIGNSDCHIIPLQFNRTYSLIDAEKNMNSIFDAIRNKKVSVVSDPLNLNEFLMVAWRMKIIEWFGKKRKF